MELDAFNVMAAVAQAHDGASAVFFGGPGADFQLGGQIFFFDDKRMIAGGRHRHRQTLKDGFVIVHDRAGLAVHDMRGANDVAAESFAYRLVPEADSEYRHLPREVADQFDADARLMRRAWAGGDDDALGTHALDLVHGNLVVAAHLDLGAQFSEVLDQVVGERIVVVEYENQATAPLLDYTGGRFQIADFRLQNVATRVVSI